MLPKRPLVVTLCGSTRFKKQFEEIQKSLTYDGCIVITPGSYEHMPDDDVTKENLDRLHLQKIDISDEIFVINVGGYIGKSTLGEIEYARANNKKIRFLETTEVKVEPDR